MVCIAFIHSFIQYFDEVNYLPFVRISDAKLSLPDFLQPSRTTETVATHPDSERRGDGPKYCCARKGANEEGKQTYQMQSYVIFWHYRLTMATFTLHRCSFRPLHFRYRSSASTLYRIKTVPLPFPVYTVPDPFDFLLRACAQQVSHCMQGRKFALNSRQNIFNVCLRKRRQLEYVPHIELQCTRCE